MSEALLRSSCFLDEHRGWVVLIRSTPCSLSLPQRTGLGCGLGFQFPWSQRIIDASRLRVACTFCILQRVLGAIWVFGPTSTR